MSCQGVTSKILGIFVPKNHYLCNDLSLIYVINSVVPSLTNPFRVISLAGPIVLRPITTFCFHWRLAPASTISPKGEWFDKFTITIDTEWKQSFCFSKKCDVFRADKNFAEFFGSKIFFKKHFFLNGASTFGRMERRFEAHLHRGSSIVSLNVAKGSQPNQSHFLLALVCLG